jgi:hypothetical protein
MSISDFANEPVKAKEETQWVKPTTTSETTIQNDGNSVTAPTVTPQPSVVSAQPIASSPSASAADSILDSVLSKIGDIGTTSSFKMMIIGPPGQSKSSFLATAPNNLIMDFEDGLMSAMGSPNGVAEGVQALPYNNFEEFGALVAGFMQGDERLKRFNVFSIDTLSDLHKRFLQEVTERDWRRQPSKNRYVPETEHYTEVNERINRVVRALRDAPVDVLITSHSKTVEPKNDTAKTYADFSESLSNKVMAQMDIVGYLQFQKVDNQMVPVLRTTTDGIIRCKTRVPMPAEIINPTYEKIRGYWDAAKVK